MQRKRDGDTTAPAEERMLGKSLCTFISSVFPEGFLCVRQGSDPGAAPAVGEAARQQT